MSKDTMKQLEMPQVADLDEDGAFFEMVKAMYLDWLRFFRKNMPCSWQCPDICPLPDDCVEIERVWLLWLETLDPEQRAIVN